jgi:multidrug resistance efflux pump
MGVGGKVVEVNFHEGEQVRKGEVMMRLETEKVDQDIAKTRQSLAADEEEMGRLEELAKLQASQFEIAQAKEETELAQVEREIATAKEKRASDVRLSELELAKAKKDEERTRLLVEQDVLPRVDLADATQKRLEAEEKLAKTSLAVDESKLEGRRKAVEMVAKDFAVKREELSIRMTAKRGAIDSARQTIANLQKEREKSVLLAHVDGIVTQGDVKVGDYIDGGKPVFAIAQQKGFRVDAAVPSADVGLLKVGMKARIKLDAYDYQKYGTLEGTIYYISPDSEVDANKQVYYVVRIRLESSELARGDLVGKVKLGMIGQAEILTGEERILSLAFRKFLNKVSVK